MQVVSTKTGRAQIRNLQLDLLRCAAIIGVLVCHIVDFRTPRTWWERLILRPGWTGVDLFFVLSGFLISGLLFSEFQKRGRINFARFAVRRALKLYPTLYALVFLVASIRLFRSHFHNLWIIASPALHDIFFVQSYWPGTYGHFWSLAVEEHFYILFPATLYFMLRTSRPGDPDPFRKLPLLFVVIAALCLSARVVHGLLYPQYSYFTHIFPTHLRLDSLLFGVLLSYWYRFHKDKFSAAASRIGAFLLPVSLLLVAPAFILEQSTFFTYTIGLTCFYCGYGGLMIWLLQVPLSTSGSAGWLLRPISYVGQHSYSIYVFHLAILEQLAKRGMLQHLSGILLYLAATIAGGIGLSKVIEFPALRFRDRLFPAQGGAAAPPPLDPQPKPQNPISDVEPISASARLSIDPATTPLDEPGI
jgi:peptidoglycan/LPS O-acetylase OafA/YrhL